MSQPNFCIVFDCDGKPTSVCSTSLKVILY